MESIDFNTILPYITAASITLNLWYRWLEYRNKEIKVLVKKAINYYKDEDKTVDDFFEVMDAVVSVTEKK